ncbi:MAG TPA: glycoside hydrolase family 3 C-terminal domain-containing protein [Terriglobia bacterium]|nr:glycoside hydrolase family 3 C-terminal domain-containing protein [Terriglobia bacterium]
MDKSLSPDARADLLVKRMTLDEKIQVVHGLPSMGFSAGFKRVAGSLGGDGFVPGILRLGIPDQQQIGAGVGITNLGQRVHGQATTLPSSLAETSTWDRKMAYDFGSVIGSETRDEGFNVSLGGGIDLARDPRCGRNFEYHGEDPILAGTILAQELRAVQDQGIVATIKHYAVNDQESGRFYVSSNLNWRALRETDLLAFEIGLKDSGVGAVMCSYNRVNDVYSCQNSYLLNDVLKLDWGFKGWVMSDWGATHSTVNAALSGLDQEMPTGVYFGDALKKAVEEREVPMSRLDNMVHRILRTLFAAGVFDNPSAVKPLGAQVDADIAQRVEERGAVLLKNAGGLLPLNASTVHSIAVIGSHADVGVLSGGGSAQVDPIGGDAVPPKRVLHGSALFVHPVWDPSSPLKAIREEVPNAAVKYDAGTDFAAAAKLAASSEVAIVFVHQWTREGADLPNLSLPDNQDQLIRQVAAANPHTVVVLENGDPVLMPWLDDVQAVLEAWYPGQRGGLAIANILFGKFDPSGKLPITFPMSESDLPRRHIQQPPPGEGYFDVDYMEGLKVGYKWYEASHIKPLFPFGYGLSYTTFSFSNLTLTPASTDGSSDVQVSFDVKNTGSRAGADVAEVYIGLPSSTDEPPQRLVGWAKVHLDRGQSHRVTVTINPQAASHPLSFWNTDVLGWDTANGVYKIYVGDSSQDIHLTGTLDVQHAGGRPAIP